MSRIPPVHLFSQCDCQPDLWMARPRSRPITEDFSTFWMCARGVQPADIVKLIRNLVRYWRKALIHVVDLTNNRHSRVQENVELADGCRISIQSSRVVAASVIKSGTSCRDSRLIMNLDCRLISVKQASFRARFTPPRNFYEMVELSPYPSRFSRLRISTP